jgi:hypothetical protein
MPLVDITYDPTLSAHDLRQLAAMLPDVVAEAVQCSEEPWVGPPGPGDIELRLRPRGEHDVGDLRVVVEVRTRRLESRAVDAQRRADRIRDGLATLDLGPIGVWLILLDGAWSQ